MKKRILITHELPGSSFRSIMSDDRFDVRCVSPEGQDEMLNVVSELSPHAIISLLSDTIDGAVMDCAPELMVISNYAVGYNNIDVAAAAASGVTVTNTPGVLTDATADIAMMLILMTTRRAVDSDRYCRNGNFTGWAPSLFLGRSLQNRTLGIIGLGRIGTAVSQRALAFGMNVRYHNRTPLPKEREEALRVSSASFDEIVIDADVISLHLPYTPENRHLIDGDVFRRMKQTAVLVNTARGKLVDENALVHALSDGEIFGAGLDVFEDEPAIHPDLVHADNAVLLPHIGSATVSVREKMAHMVVSDCMAVLRGEKAENTVTEG